MAGRFTGWELETDAVGAAQFHDPKQTDGLIVSYAGIRAKMLIDRVFKGAAPTEITVTSWNTVDVYDHEPEYVWIGPTGACGAFGEDPTGRYAIMGLRSEEEDTYRASILSWFYGGEEPPADYGGRSLSRLSPLLPGYLPSSGGMPASGGSFPGAVAIAAAVLGPLAFLAGAAFLWRRAV